jgi:hypothetical protein
VEARDQVRYEQRMPRMDGIVARLAALGSVALFGVACSGSGSDSGSGSGSDERTSRSEAALGGCPAAGASNLEFMGDACKKKRTPSDKTRAVGCPIVSTVATGFSSESVAPVFDVATLKPLVPAELKVTVILIRHVNGVPLYRYLSNGTQDDIFQPWSSTKFIAASGAGAALRRESAGKVGLTSKTTGSSGAIPLGDLVTVVASYREDRYTSNGLAHYFLNVAGRAAVGTLVHGWLGRPAAETYGGNYGVAAPSDLGYTFTETSGDETSVSPDDASGPANALSTHTTAETLKRLAAWDDIATRMPDLDRADVETLFYGPATSTWYPGEMAGLSANVAVYMQNALDMDAVEKNSGGSWRVLGKLGAGNGDLVSVDYACLPDVDPVTKAPLADRGAEIVIASRLASGGASIAARDQILADAYKTIVAAVLPLAQTPNPAAPGSPDGGSDGGVAIADGGAAGDAGALPVDDGSTTGDSGCALAPRATRSQTSSDGAWAVALAALLVGARRRRSYRPTGPAA